MEPNLDHPIIQCQSLRKNYGTHAVLHDLSFEIQAGKMIGFLGPNGAGKTTTLRILLGLLKQSAGTARVFGRNCQADGKSIRAKVGYLPGDVHLYPNMSAIKTLRFLAAARQKNCESEIQRLRNVLGLDLSRTVRKFSTGMRQKLGLIQSLMHRPDLLILDEPTSALDPLIRESVFDELRNVVNDGRTVLFSSHSLAEVEEICDEVIILRDGHLVEQQKIGDLKDKALRRIRVSFANAEAVPNQYPEAFNLISIDGPNVVGGWTGSSAQLIDWLNQQQLADLIVEKPDLNDLFLTYYQHQGET